MRRFARYRTKRNSWNFQFQTKNVIAVNDGEEVLGSPNNNTQNHPLKQNASGSCSSGSTNYQACSGTDLAYFNANIASNNSDFIAGTCEVRCNNNNSNYIYKWIDTLDNAVLPSAAANSIDCAAVNSAVKSGYTSGCNAYVATPSIAVSNNDIADCSTGFSSSQSTNSSNHGRFQNHSSSIPNVVSYGAACSASENSCNNSQKSTAISAAGWGSIGSSNVSCERSCSNNNLSSFNASRKAPAEFCEGFSANDAAGTYSGSCSSSETSSAVAAINLALTQAGISSPNVNSGDINCNYTCAHVVSEIDNSTVRITEDNESSVGRVALG